MTKASDLPLAGVRVVDMTSTIAGPSATRHLADFGAEVIKIESLRHPDGSRMGSPYAGGVKGINRSGYFSAYNAGKCSLQLNMTRPEARDILRRLIQVSDVLVEAFAPGVFRRWGLGYDVVREWNPRIVMASHSLQGQTGPRAPHRGFGQLSSALSGWFDLTGLKDEDPVGPYSAYTDFIAWPVLFASVLTALELRDVTGEGCYIDHSHVESSAYFATPEVLAVQLGDPPRRDGNHDAYAAPNNAYRCAGDDDRWIALTVTTDAEWRALCELLVAPDLRDDPRFASHAARKANEDALDVAVGERTRQLDAFQLADALVARGVAAGVVYKAEDLFRDPQLQHRQAFHRVDHAEIGVHSVVAPTYTISGVCSGPFRAMPLIGEHNDYICRELLGMGDDELAELIVNGVLE
jgi:benzylsuccinate CoA-transferase BbsF subunit